MAAFDDLKTQVEATVGAEQSALVLLQGLEAEVADLAAKVAGTPAEADVVALRDKLAASQAALSAAVAANPTPTP